MPLPQRIAMRLSIALALALGLLGAVSVAPSEPIAKLPVVGQALAPQPAHAGECTSQWLDICGRMKNIGNLGVGVVHNWTSNPTYSAILHPGQYTDRSPSCCYWRDTDGFYVGTGYAVQIRKGGLYYWYYWYGCTTVNNYCKVGYYKIPDMTTGTYWYITAVSYVG